MSEGRRREPPEPFARNFLVEREYVPAACEARENAADGDEDARTMAELETSEIEYRTNPPLTEAQLEELYQDAWGVGCAAPYGPVLERSLAYAAAFQGDRLVGFANLAWDGGAHAFITDAMVRSDFRHRGIGLELVRHAVAKAREAGVRWVHADYEPHLDGFFARAGFLPTRARVLHVGTGA